MSAAAPRRLTEAKGSKPPKETKEKDAPGKGAKEAAKDAKRPPAMERLDLSVANSDSRISISLMPKSPLDAEYMEIDTGSLYMDYESILLARKEEIAADPLKHMLLFPEADIDVQSVEQKLRTTVSSVPATAKNDPTLDLFATESIHFIESKHSLVVRRHKAFATPAAAGVSKDEPLDHQYEVDIRTDIVQLDLDSPPADERPRSLGQRVLNFHRGTTISIQSTKAKKEAIPPSGKFKKRRVDVVIVDGTVSLEVLKEGSDKVVDSITVERDSYQIVEGLPTMLRITTLSGPAYFQAESSAACTELVEQFEEELQRLARPPSSTHTSVSGISPDLFREREHRHLDDAELERLWQRRTLAPMAAQSLFGLFNPGSDLVSADGLQGAPPPPFAEVFGLRFVVMCDRLVLDLSVADSAPKNPEPFFCSLALFDVRSFTKLSENFYFDFADAASTTSAISGATGRLQAVFSVEEAHAEIYLLLLVEKVLQGSVDSVSDIYSKPSSKADEQARNAQKVLQSHLGALRMPFAWAARPVFVRSTNELDSGGKFSSLFRHDSAHLREDDMLKNLVELNRVAQAGSKPKFSVIPGQFFASVLPYEIAPALNTITHGELSVTPFKRDQPIARREVLSFPCGIILNPRLTYANYLFVYPRAINFSAKQSSFRGVKHVRNILVQVQLFESDVRGLTQVGEGLRCIYNKGQLGLTNFAHASVSHHTEWPGYYEEVKIELPPNLNDRHHLFFTFFHVVVSSKKKEREKKTPIGFAFLPVLTDKGQHAAGDFDLPVASAEHRYDSGGTNYILPPYYTRARPSAAATIGNNSSSSLGSGGGVGGVGGVNGHAGGGGGAAGGEHMQSNIKWVERDEPIFKLACRPYSTVYASDKQLRTFFRLCELTNWGTVPGSDPAALVTAVKALHALPTDELVSVFPTLFNALLRLLPANPKASPLGIHIVQFLVFAASTITRAPAPHAASSTNVKENTLLSTYLYYNFRAPRLSSGNTVHEELVRAINAILSERTNLYEKLIDDMCRHVSLFLQLISKSMAQCLALNELLQAPRSTRFPEDYLANLRTMLRLLVRAMIRMVASGPSSVKPFNESIATFLTACFGLMDRGYVLALVKLYCTIVAKDQIPSASLSLMTGCKLDLFWRLCNYEHYIPLNLPFADFDPLRNQEPYLTAMLLGELETLMRTRDDKLLCRKALTMVRLLLIKHENDPRYQDPQCKSRIALLYFPLVKIAITNLSLLKGEVDVSSTDTDTTDTHLEIGEIRELLMTILFVLRHCEQSYIKRFLAAHANDYFSLLVVCVRTFQYRGIESLPTERAVQTQVMKKVLESPGADKNWRDKRNRVASTVLSPAVVSSTSATTLRPRTSSSGAVIDRRPSVASSPALVAARSRMSTGPSVFFTGADEGLAVANDKAVAAAIAHEVGLIVAQQILAFIQDGFHVAARTTQQTVNELVLLMLNVGQSTGVIEVLAYTIRLLVEKFHTVIFNPELDFCRPLVLQILVACNSVLPPLQYNAVVLLYALLEKNFQKASLYASIAISALESKNLRNVEDLRLSLSSLARLARSGPYPKEVGLLAERLRTILHSTQQLKLHSQDPEMLIDLMSRIADSYSHSPQLRVTWLENIAVEHIKRGLWVEAAMCCLHCAAIVAEALKPTKELLKDGCLMLRHLTPNVATEAEPSVDFSEVLASIPLFSERGLIKILQSAIEKLRKAQCYELVSRVYNVIMPILERDRRFADLQLACADMQQCFSSIILLNKTNKRRLGTYYLVKFFGRKFGADLDNVQLVYREPHVTPLSEISLRLQKQFQQSFGADKVVMITDSKDVDPADLCADFAYMQIVFVEPFFPSPRATYFEQNHDISLFVYETPFTKSGKAHGSVTEQWKRKTVIHVETLSFPCIRKRLLVDRVESQQELTPIEVAIEEIERKVAALRAVLVAEPIDMKILQMQIQGTVSLQVNAGPMEIATAFLGSPTSYDAALLQRLTHEFDQLVYFLHLGLAKNEKLVQVDQKEYHRDLQTRFEGLKTQLRKFFEPSITRRENVDVDAELVRLRGDDDNTDIKFLADM